MPCTCVIISYHHCPVSFRVTVTPVTKGIGTLIISLTHDISKLWDRNPMHKVAAPRFEDKNSNSETVFQWQCRWIVSLPTDSEKSLFWAKFEQNSNAGAECLSTAVYLMIGHFSLAFPGILSPMSYLLVKPPQLSTWRSTPVVVVSQWRHINAKPSQIFSSSSVRSTACSS